MKIILLIRVQRVIRVTIYDASIDSWPIFDSILHLINLASLIVCLIVLKWTQLNIILKCNFIM